MIQANLEFLENNQGLGRGRARAALQKIRATTSMQEALAAADYVQESVPDRYDLKKRIFSQIDGLAPRTAIAASSSSGLLMTEIQSGISTPERCLLVHPFQPVHLVPLVEIAGGRDTAAETCRTVFELMQHLGKFPVLLKREVPGYIVNRLQAALVREAIDLVDKGVADPQDVDQAFRRGLGVRDPVLGPFLRMHTAAGDGIEAFFEHYADSYHARWQDMACWDTVPDSARKAVIDGVNQMKMIRTKSMRDIQEWRDRMLLKIVNFVSEEDDLP
jgi:3-hydroxypropionate dehydrogenase (NADP+)